MRVFSLVRWMWGLSSVVLAAGVLLAPTAAAAGFGVEPGSLVAGAFQVDGNGPLDEGAMPDSQAGDHPYEMVTRLRIGHSAFIKWTITIRLKRTRDEATRFHTKTSGRCSRSQQHPSRQHNRRQSPHPPHQ